jgi:hypothetical protein
LSILVPKIDRRRRIVERDGEHTVVLGGF